MPRVRKANVGIAASKDACDSEARILLEPMPNSASFILLTSLLGFALVPAPALDAPAKTKADDQGQRGSVLRVDSGTLFTADGVPIQLRRVKAKITTDGSNNGKPGCEDPQPDPDKSPQVVNIESGDVVLTSESLTKLLNQKVGKEGKLKNLRFSTDVGKHEVEISGKTKKVIDVPFQLKGPVTTTPDGQLQLKAKSIKALEIPGLAGLLGLNVEKAAGKDTAKGVKSEENTITFNPDQLWGLPVHGRVIRVDVQPNGLLLVFAGEGNKDKSARPVRRASTSKPGIRK